LACKKYTWHSHENTLRYKRLKTLDRNDHATNMAAIQNLDDIFTNLFDESSIDGLSDDVYQKMVTVVSFLSKNYHEVPGDIFNDYLFTTMEILKIKDDKFPEHKNDEIPRDLLDDLRLISLP